MVSRQVLRHSNEQKWSWCVTVPTWMQPVMACDCFTIVMQPSRPHLVRPNNSSSLGGRSIGSWVIRQLLSYCAACIFVSWPASSGGGLVLLPAAYPFAFSKPTGWVCFSVSCITSLCEFIVVAAPVDFFIRLPLFEHDVSGIACVSAVHRVLTIIVVV